MCLPIYSIPANSMLSFYLSLSSSSVHLAIYVFYLFYLYCLSISQSIRLSIYLSMRSLSLLHSTHFYPVLSSYCVIQTTYLDIPFYSYLSLYPPVYIHIIMYILSVLFFLSLLDFIFIFFNSWLFYAVLFCPSIHPSTHPPVHDISHPQRFEWAWYQPIHQLVYRSSFESINQLLVGTMVI